MADPMTALMVWYDGACPLCIREIALMRRLDKRQAISFVDVAPEGVACPIDRQLLLDRFHAQETGEPIVSGAAAFAAMWRVIPLLRPLGLIARSSVVLAVLERSYLAFLKIRPTLQRLVSR
jgi:predicted DCC family thiol-disulfide oxidoreductase YuxK